MSGSAGLLKRLSRPLPLFLAGALHVAAFAPLGWWPLSFISLAFLFHRWHQATPREAAWQGYAWGLGCFLVGVSWVYVSMHDVGGMPAVEEKHAAVLAILADGEPWSSSALALALGISPRSVQRALEELARSGKVQSFGHGRARRWMTPPVPGFPTGLLLPTPLLKA